MKLEYLDATGNGAFPDASPARLVRLSQFNEEQIALLISAIQRLVSTKNDIWLSELPFVDSINCKLKLKISDEDNGILSEGDDGVFVCALTTHAYDTMVDIITFVENGHNWLTPGEYLDDPAFLISRFGSW
jgi:hypothetical protein